MIWVSESCQNRCQEKRGKWKAVEDHYYQISLINRCFGEVSVGWSLHSDIGCMNNNPNFGDVRGQTTCCSKRNVRLPIGRDVRLPTDRHKLSSNCMLQNQFNDLESTVCTKTSFIKPSHSEFHQRYKNCSHPNNHHFKFLDHQLAMRKIRSQCTQQVSLDH